MARKQTNLAVAADVGTIEEMLSIADQVSMLLHVAYQSCVLYYVALPHAVTGMSQLIMHLFYSVSNTT